MNDATEDKFFNQELDIVDFAFLLWEKKLTIILITTFFAFFSVLFSLMLPNIYKSESILAPTESDNSLSAQLMSISPIARLGGMNIPQENSSKSEEALARIQSYDFFVKYFLPNIDSRNLSSIKKWDSSDNKIIYFKENENSSKPSNQELFIAYNEILSINKNLENSFINISIAHQSPYIAKEWLNLIIDSINNSMRNEYIIIAENSINFLKSSLEDTNVQPIKDSISDLLENQLQALMLAKSNDDYIFKRLSSPVASEYKDSPNRTTICILGAFIGLIFSTFFVVIQNLITNKH